MPGCRPVSCLTRGRHPVDTSPFTGGRQLNARSVMRREEGMWVKRVAALAAGIGAGAFACVSPDQDVLRSQCNGAGQAQLLVEYEQTGFPLVRPEPVYPPLAEHFCLSGWVLVAFPIEPSGKLGAVRVLESDPPWVFEQSVGAALQRWIYNPTPNLPAGAQDRACALIKFRFSSSALFDREPPEFSPDTCNPMVPVAPHAA